MLINRFDQMLSIRNNDFNLYLIDVPGYRSNISFSRAISHYIFSRNFISWFKSYCAINGTPDIIYCAYPLAGPILFLSKYKRLYPFKLVVDVQDVWPESIKPAFRFLSFIPDRLFPFFWKADRVYSAADALVAVSQTYLDRAKSDDPHVPSHVCYIGCSFAFVRSQSHYHFDPIPSIWSMSVLLVPLMISRLLLKDLIFFSIRMIGFDFILLARVR